MHGGGDNREKKRTKVSYDAVEISHIVQYSTVQYSTVQYNIVEKLAIQNTIVIFLILNVRHIYLAIYSSER